MEAEIGSDNGVKEKSEIKDKVRNIPEYIFILTSCIELALGILQMCRYEMSLRRLILWGFFAVYLAVACTNHYSRTEKICLAVCLTAGGILYVCSGINTGIKLPVYVCALKKINIRKLFQWMLATMVITTVGVMAASLFWGFGTWSIEDSRDGVLFLGIRYSLGFAHPNVLQFMMFSMLSYYLLLYGEKMSLTQYIILGAGYAGLFRVTFSRTGFIVGILVLMLAVAFRFGYLHYFKKMLLAVYVILIGIFLVVSFAAAAGMNGNGMMEVVNKFIGGRVGQLGIHTGSEQSALPYISNWRLFSSRINKNVYDMGYIQIFYYYGIIPAICYLGFVCCAFYRGFVRKNKFGCLILAGFSIYLFTESLFFSNYLTKDFLAITAAGILFSQEQN